jgi:ubiquitin carboxyl-terminal hydrolase 4/11/15
LIAKWFKQWKKFVGFDTWDTDDVGKGTAHPGSIDNRPMLKDGTSDLKDHLIEELDYVLLPRDAWNLLVQLYTVGENQQPIERKVIEQGMFVKQCKVEVYLMVLRFALNNDMENIKVRHFSRADKICSIEKDMRSLFNINEDKNVRLWNKYMTNTH